MIYFYFQMYLIEILFLLSSEQIRKKRQARPASPQPWPQVRIT